MVCNGQARLGYDWNRIIHLEPEPKFRFQLAGSGYGFPNYGSSMNELELACSKKNQNWVTQNPVLTKLVKIRLASKDSGSSSTRA